MARKSRKEVAKEEEKDEDATEQQQPPAGSGAKIPRKKRRLSAIRVGVDSTADVKVAADVDELQSSKKKSRRTSKSITPKNINQPADDKAVVEGDAMKRIKKSEEATRKRKKKLLEGAREDAKIDFGIHRSEVLGRVPEDYKKMFGQLGFAKWAKGSLLPALIVSPYNVPMGDGSVRDKWLKMLDNLEQQGRLAKLTYIVYWYGSKTPTEYYSFVTKSAFMAESSKEYQKHMKKLEDAQAKVDTNENAPLATQERARKYREMQEDLRKPPEERSRGGFKEGYELLSMSDVDELASDADESLEDDTGEEKVESKPAPKKKMKASKVSGAEAKKKSKKKIVTEESDETLRDGPSMKIESVDDLDDIGETDENSEDDDYLDPNTKASKAGSAKMKKIKAEKEDIEPQSGDKVLKDSEDGDYLDPNTKASKAGSAKMKKIKAEKEDIEPQSGDKVLKDEQPAEVGSDIGDVDEDSVDDERDVDFKEDEEEEDEKDEDFEADFKDTTKQKSAKILKMGSKAKRPTQKEAPAKKQIPKKHKAQLSAEDQRKKDIKKHQKDFAVCEVKHFDTLETWKVAIQAEDADKVSDILGGFLTEVEAIPASFIEGYQLPALMKSSKALLKKTDSKDLDSYHDVWKRMKATYEEGKEKIPIGFKPNKRKPLTNPVTKHENPKEKKVSVSASREKAPASAIKSEKLVQDTEDLPSSQEVPNIPIPKRGVSAMDETLKNESDSKAANPVRASLPKPERKKFTLGSLMRPNSKDTVAQDASVSVHGSGRASATKTKQSPSWVIGSCTLEVPVDSDRSMALDFLREMATHFPPGKITVETFALSLEAAIFQWASSKDEWQDDYWEKVHCLVAAIAGKRGQGSLMRFIMDGYFTAPKELVLLPDHILADSFEGRHLRFDGRQ